MSRRATAATEFNKNEAIFALNLSWMANDDFHLSSMMERAAQCVDGLINIQKPSGCVESVEESLKVSQRWLSI